MSTPTSTSAPSAILPPPNLEGLPRLRETIRGFVRSRVRDAALAEDLTQETLLRVQTRLSSLRAADRLHAWVLQIARNVISDHFRTARETEPFEESTHAGLMPTPEAGPGTDDGALSRELSAYVRSVVGRLPPAYREAVELTEIGGVSQVELARRLGLTVSAAKSRVQRGRAMLRKEMERCCRWETDRYGTVLAVEPLSACTCQDPERGVVVP